MILSAVNFPFWSCYKILIFVYDWGVLGDAGSLHPTSKIYCSAKLRLLPVQWKNIFRE